MHADLIRLTHTGIDADVDILFRSPQVSQQSDGGQKIPIGVFGVNSRLDGMPTDGKCLLITGEQLTGGDQQLPFNQILTGNHLGDRMFNLQAGVHLHKVEGAIFIKQKLDSTGTYIADRFGRCDRCFAHLTA